MARESSIRPAPIGPRGLRLQTRRPDRGLAEDFATLPRPIWPCGPGVEKWLEPRVISPRIIDRNRRTRVMNVTEPSWWGLPSDPCKPSVLLSRTSIRIIAAVILTLLYCPPLNLMENCEVSIWRTWRENLAGSPESINELKINEFVEYLQSILRNI